VIAVGLAILLAALAATLFLWVLVLYSAALANDYGKDLEVSRHGTLTLFPRVNKPVGLFLVGLGIIVAMMGLYRLIAT
jgi:uncharacterized membrane protein